MSEVNQNRVLYSIPEIQAAMARRQRVLADSMPGKGGSWFPVAGTKLLVNLTAWDSTFDRMSRYAAEKLKLDVNNREATARALFASGQLYGTTYMLEFGVNDPGSPDAGKTFRVYYDVPFLSDKLEAAVGDGNVFRASAMHMLSFLKAALPPDTTPEILVEEANWPDWLDEIIAAPLLFQVTARVDSREETNKKSGKTYTRTIKWVDDVMEVAADPAPQPVAPAKATKKALAAK